MIRIGVYDGRGYGWDFCVHIYKDQKRKSISLPDIYTQQEIFRKIKDNLAYVKGREGYVGLERWIELPYAQSLKNIEKKLYKIINSN